MPARRKTHRARPPAKPPAKSRGAGALVAFILIAYAAIAVAYAISIPFGQAPDESAHLPYVEYLAEARRLPVFQPGHGSYEFHQAPLYYITAVPAFVIGRALAPGREYLAVRFFGIIIGLCVVYFTYRLARDFWPERPRLATAAAGFVAFLPMHIALSASVTNDVAAEVPFSIALWQMVVGLKHGWTWPRALGMGALCGAAVLVKSSGLALLPVAWLALALTAREAGLRRVTALMAAMTAVTLAVCGWWLARNQVLYGDPLAWGAFLQAFAENPHPGDLVGPNLSVFNYLLWVIGWTFASFWGVFGNMKVFMPTWGVYMPLAAVTVAAAAGLVLELAGARSWDSWRKRTAWVLGVTVMLVLASFVRFNVSFFQAQGRYLFPALPAVAVGFTLGWGRAFPPALRDTARSVLWFALLALAVCALPLWILPAMTR
jgi:4-amino-4-deoxy-L-arabinose transferase-like glycosyltransferase